MEEGTRPHKRQKTTGNGPSSPSKPSAKPSSKGAGSGGPSAWSTTNLIAVPSPDHSSIHVSHFATSQRIAFSIPLPPSVTASSPSRAKRRIKKLTFGPDATVLLAVLSAASRDPFLPSGSAPVVGDENEDESGERLVLWTQNATIDDWSLSFDEPLASLLAPTSANNADSTVVSVRWLGEQRKWYPNPTYTNREGGGKPLICAPMRCAPILGTELLFMLDPASVLFLRLPPATAPSVAPSAIPPPPMHLHLPLSHPSSSLAKAFTPTAQSTVDNLVNSLITADGTPAASGSTTEGAGALKVELEKKKKVDGGADGAKKSERVKDASIGCVRNAGSAFDLSLTVLLLAYIPSPPLSNPSQPLPLTVPPSQKPRKASISASFTPKTDTNNDDWLGEMGMGDLDDAFGGGSGSGIGGDMGGGNTSKVEEGKEDDEDRGERRGGKWKRNEVKLAELRIDGGGMEGTRLTLLPLSPLNPSYPPSSLFFTEDLLPPPPRTPPTQLPPPLPASSGKEKEKERERERERIRESERVRERDPRREEDLRLVVLGDKEGNPSESSENDSMIIEGLTNSAGLGGGQKLESFGFDYVPYALSEAFANLDCKKSDKTTGGKEWAITKLALSSLESGASFSAVMGAAEGGGPVWSSFAAVVESEEGTREMVVFDASSLEPKEGLSKVRLPDWMHYDHLAISPNRTLLCATSSSKLLPSEIETGEQVKSVVIAALNTGLEIHDVTETLGLALAAAVAKQADTSDVIGRVTGFKDEVKIHQVLRITRDTLQGLLKPAMFLSQHSIQLELFGAMSTLYGSSPGLLLRGSIARDLVQIAGCARAFQRCEKKDRGQNNSGYRCESDAVWPLIGHLTWYCDFSRDLALELKSSPSIELPPRLLLLLHPLPRTQLLRIASSIIGLQGFLMSFVPNTNATVDVSRSVVDDAIDQNGLIVREWKTVLGQIADLPGLGSDGPELQETLLTLTVHPALHTVSTLLRSLLASPSLFLPSIPPTPPATPKENSHESQSIDVVRRSRLPSKGRFKKCTKCGERTERVAGGAVENEMGRWSGWENAWEGRCSCGGLWVAVDVKS